jgi:hypothetical protein
MHKPLFPALVLAAACAIPSSALASPIYPGTVARELDLDCTPECTLCHTQATGGFATVNTPFGLTVRMQHGLECCDTELLAGVLAEIREEETDSDDDGTSDVTELQALTSPNTEDDVDLACQPAEKDSGCSVSYAGAAHPGIGSGLFLAGVFLVMAAVRRFT